MAPPSAEFVTLCDQDDAWHPDKLERLLRADRGTPSSSTATPGSSTRAAS